VCNQREIRRLSDSGDHNVADPEIFAAQYRQLYPRLRLIAEGITGDRAHADDIVQDAAMIALEKINSFAPGSSFSAWLAEIVRRCSLNYTRKHQRRRTSTADPHILTQTTNATHEAADTRAIVSEQGELVDLQSAFDDEVVRALDELEHEPRCCLLLRVVQNLSYIEISDLMGIPQGTAMSHVHRSKKVLRDKLHLVHGPSDHERS